MADERQIGARITIRDDTATGVNSAKASAAEIAAAIKRMGVSSQQSLDLLAASYGKVAVAAGAVAEAQTTASARQIISIQRTVAAFQEAEQQKRTAAAKTSIENIYGYTNASSREIMGIQRNVAAFLEGEKTKREAAAATAASMVQSQRAAFVERARAEFGWMGGGGGRGGGGDDEEEGEGRGGGRRGSSVATNEMRHGTAIFDSLARGNKGQAVSSIGAALRDAGLSAGVLATSFGGFVALLAGGAVVRGQENLGKWVQDMQAGAAATGMSTQQYASIQTAFQLIGEKADTGDRAIRHFATSLGTAMTDPASKAAAAFNSIGITQDVLRQKGQDVSGMLTMTIGRLTEYANSTGKANAQTDIFGQSFEKLATAADKGAGKFEELKAKAAAMNKPILDNADSIEKVSGRLDELGIKASKDWSAAFVKWQGPLNGAIDLLGQVSSKFASIFGWIGKIDSMQLHGIMDAGRWVQQKADSAAAALGLNLNSPSYGQKAVDPKNPSGLTPLSGGQMTGSINDKTVSESLKASHSSMAEDALSLHGNMIELNEMIREEKQATKEAAEAEKARVAAIFQGIRFGLDADKAYLDGVEQAQREKLNAIKQGAQNSEASSRSTQANAGFSSLVSGGKGNQFADATAASRAIAEQAKQEIASLQEVANDANNTAEVRKAAAEEVLRVVTDAETKMTELYRSSGSAAKMSSDVFLGAWQQAFSSLDASMDQFAANVTKALLAPKQELIKAGLTTIKINLAGSEIKTAAQQMALAFASEFTTGITKGLSSLAAGGIAKMLGMNIAPGTGIGGLVGQAIGGGGGGGEQAAQFGITATNLAAFNTALTASTATLSGHAAAVTTSTSATALDATAKTTSTGITAAHAAATATDTGGVLAHVGATITDTAGFIAHAASVAYDTGAEVVHAVLSLFGLEGGGIVGSAAAGMVTSGIGGRGVDGRGGSLNVLHPKEMVLPAHLSTGIQNMINKGGDNNSRNFSANLNFSPVVNGRGSGGNPMSDLRSMSTGMMGEARNAIRRGMRF